MKKVLVFILVLLVQGCALNTVYVPDGKAVRLRQPVKNAKIWALDKSGKPVPGTMTLPNGWFVMPDPEAK